MNDWIYDGYTKVHSPNRRHMIEQWIWKCVICGYTVRKPFGNNNKPQGDCPKCLAKREQEASVENQQYCERYQQTYNPDDGSM